MDNKSGMLLTLKQNIRTLRTEKGLTQTQLAKAADVSLKTVQKWERETEEKWPDLYNLIKVCDVFECDLDFLTGRIKKPTHDIQFIHERTGLNATAIRKLIKNKAEVMDSPISDIIEHPDYLRLLRVLTLAADEDEVAWLNLDELPRDLLSSYAERPIDFSVGIGSEVAEYLASQELTTIIRKIREKNEKEKSFGQWQRNKHHYNVYAAKRRRAEILEELEQTVIDLGSEIEYLSNTDEFKVSEADIEVRQREFDRTNALWKRVEAASFAEWQRGDILKEVNELLGKE